MSTLEEELHAALAIHVPSEERRIQIHALLAPLKYKSYATYPYYAHCIRVGLLSLKIARFTGNNEAEISVAGLLHDVGKALVDHRVLLRALGLEGAGPFTTEDMEEMKKHPMLGFQLLQGSFDTTAEIIVRHHSFQKNPYPDNPPYIGSHTGTVEDSIEQDARLVALADVYDALHRPNGMFDGHGGLTGGEIQRKMFGLNPDQAVLVGELYQAGIFKTSGETHT